MEYRGEHKIEIKIDNDSNLINKILNMLNIILKVVVYKEEDMQICDSSQDFNIMPEDTKYDESISIVWKIEN